MLKCMCRLRRSFLFCFSTGHSFLSSSHQDSAPHSAILDDVEPMDGQQWCFGNLTLASLNLTGQAMNPACIYDSQTLSHEYLYYDVIGID